MNAEEATTELYRRIEKVGGHIAVDPGWTLGKVDNAIEEVFQQAIDDGKRGGLMQATETIAKEGRERRKAHPDSYSREYNTGDGMVEAALKLYRMAEQVGKQEGTDAPKPK